MLDMMFARYKAKMKSGQWHMYLWLHNVMTYVVNAWILYHRDQKELGSKRILTIYHMPISESKNLVLHLDGTKLNFERGFFFSSCN